LCGPVLPNEQFLYGLRSASAAYIDALIPSRAGKEIVFEYSSDTSAIPDYNSDSSLEFDFGLDSIQPESDHNSTKKPLSGPAAGLVITSTPAGRFVYWPNPKPKDLTNDNSRCIAYLKTLHFQEGTPLTPTSEDYMRTMCGSRTGGWSLPGVMSD
jgi:hypothetical protein